jgi:two-component system, NtrC family, sensor kinase
MIWPSSMFQSGNSIYNQRTSMRRMLSLGVLTMLLIGHLLAQLTVTESISTQALEGHVSLYIEKGNSANAEAVGADSSLFKSLSTVVIPIMGDDKTYWVKIDPLENHSGERLLLNIANPLLDSLIVYRIKNGKLEALYQAGSQAPYALRQYDTPDFLVDLELEQGQTASYLIRLRSEERIVIPLSLGSERSILSVQARKDLFMGVFFGIMIVIVLYNFSLFLITREMSYLYYVLYIGFFTLTQAGFTGYSFQFLFRDYPAIFNKSITVFAGLAGIFAIFFARNFLHLREFTPRLDKGMNLFLVSYSLAIVFSMAGWRHLAFGFIDFSGLFLSLYGLVFSAIITAKGYRPAKFFLIAWSLFIVGMVLFVLRNLGVIPHTFITGHTMQIGSALEAILFSIALADKINILKKEKEISQAEALALSLENERITREQNLVLEERVLERTLDLEKANRHLKETLTTLKEAQVQLVNAEKMASLGQLTAGIAHEINNPINFVSSNIRPLRRDIEDILTIIQYYEDRTGNWSPEQLREMEAIKKQLDFDYLKEELQILINGIEEGANRTAEIVKGLRIFSRVDESDLKKADINQGIDSTLILLNSSMGGKIQVLRDFAEDAIIECYPGKLNQVFMNLLTNAIQAIQAGQPRDGGLLHISTRLMEDRLEIRIRDNGPGMTDEVRERIFEPFFTTKLVGQGTGLGLSIVHAIIESHNGTIRVESVPEKGTEFIILLPVRHNHS